MPSPHPSVFLPRDGGSDSIRTTVSIGFSADFPEGTVVCSCSDGKIRPCSSSHPNDPMLGIVERLHPPMKTEADVVLSGLVRIEWIEHGKTYHLAGDGTLSTEGSNPVLQGIKAGEGMFTRPQENKHEMPTGTLLPFAGKSIPRGWLSCDGSFIDQRNYPRLHSLLLEDVKSVKAQIVSASSSLMVLSYRGTMMAGTLLSIETLGWRGTGIVVSCHEGLLTIAASDELPKVSQVAGGVCMLSSLDLSMIPLPLKNEDGMTWIVKT